jgi:hypothetical protein
MILAEFENTGLLEACVRKNQNKGILRKQRDNKSVVGGTSRYVGGT